MVRPCVFALVLALCLAPRTLCAQEAAPVQSVAETASAPVGGDLIPVASHVRIVRLSQIQGGAELDRNTGRGFEPAFANIPITAGSRLRTGEGTAEVEFEDGSTLRLAPATEFQFQELGRTATGQTVTVGTLVHGMTYVSLGRTPGAQFVVTAEKVRLELHPGSHVRFGYEANEAHLAVMEGAVDLQGPAGNTVIAKKQSTDFQPLGTQPYEVASNIRPEPFDSWDKDAAKFQQHYSNASFGGGTGMLFGSADLNYYGSFSNAGGCGSLWRPYFASAGWDPYGAGMWAWYPSAGYSWVSPYPWGWMPFHSGSWTNCPGVGWGWAPGSSWYGLGNQPAVLQRVATLGHGTMPLPPPAPRGHEPHFVPSGSATLTASRLTAPGTFTFRSNSAGLGVPREAFGNLRGMSANVARHGSATTVAEVGSLGSGGGAHLGPADFHGATTQAHSVPVIAHGSAASTASTGGGGAQGFSPSIGTSSGSHSVSMASSSMSAGAGAGHAGGGGSAGGGGGHR